MTQVVEQRRRRNIARGCAGFAREPAKLVDQVRFLDGLLSTLWARLWPLVEECDHAEIRKNGVLR